MNYLPAKEQQEFASPGDRLNYILDFVGFHEGRGRVSEFKTLLETQSPDEFVDLKYTTVRSWFNDNAPTMRKIDAIIKMLADIYELEFDLQQLKTWWKLGGRNPFDSFAIEVDRIQEQLKEDQEKNNFLVIKTITEVAGEELETLSSKDLLDIKDSVLNFMQLFANPVEVTCPREYIEMIIKNKLSNIQGNKI